MNRHAMLHHGLEIAKETVINTGRGKSRSHESDLAVSHLKQVVRHLISSHQVVGNHTVGHFAASCSVQIYRRYRNIFCEKFRITMLELAHHDQTVCLLFKDDLRKFTSLLHFVADHFQHRETVSGDCPFGDLLIKFPVKGLIFSQITVGNNNADRETFFFAALDLAVTPFVSHLICQADDLLPHFLADTFLS